MLAHFISNPFIRSETPALQSTTHPGVFLQQPRQLCRGDWNRNGFCQQQLFTYLSFQKWMELKHENNVLFQMTWQERKLMVQVLIKLGREKNKKGSLEGKIHSSTYKDWESLQMVLFLSVLDPVLPLKAESVRVISLKHQFKGISLFLIFILYWSTVD